MEKREEKRKNEKRQRRKKKQKKIIFEKLKAHIRLDDVDLLIFDRYHFFWGSQRW